MQFTENLIQDGEVGMMEMVAVESKPKADTEKEERRLRTQVENNPQSRRARLELAKFLFRQQQYEEAIQLCNSVLETEAGNAHAFLLLARIHGFGDPRNCELAETHFKKAIELDARYAKAHYFFAYMLRSQLNRLEEAEHHYKKAMELRPDDVMPFNDCAIMYARQGRNVEARALYERALEIDSSHAVAHFNLANLLRKDFNAYELAETHFQEAVRLKPRFVAALNNYATMLHHQLHQYEEAETLYTRALSVDNKYARAHFNYANLCREYLHKFDVAEDHYKSAIALCPNNPNFHNNYGLLLQYALDKPGEAEKEFHQALQLNPEHALAHCNYATVLMQLDDGGVNLSTAEEHFKQALELDGGLVMAHNNFGCLLKKMGRIEEATVQFEQALSLDPNFDLAKRNLKRQEGRCRVQ